MISYQQGDLFTSGLPAIAHGCNCRGVMGAGIAAQFRTRYPAMYESYRQYCAGGMLQPGDIFSWESWDMPSLLANRKMLVGSDDVVVFNLATQLDPGANAQPWMIATAVGRMIQVAHGGYSITEIGLPMIGCGIGGLHAGDLREALAPYADAPVSLIVFEYFPAVIS